jgi:nucleotide-binding universal stress UspA family protein
MMKILIGYDGSESADAALSDLQQAGLPQEAEALVISVADLLMTADASNYETVGHALMSRRVTSGLMYAEKVREQAEEFSERALDRIRSLFPDWSVRAEVLSGTAWAELIRRANEWKPDLVVLGSHGRSAIGRLILGSVSTKVASDSHYSVRVSRPPAEGRLGKPPRIMIGVDGSPQAERAVREVGSRVWPAGTEVRIVAVDAANSQPAIDDIVTIDPELLTGCNEDVPLAARMMVEWAQSELEAIGLNVSSYLEKGDPKTVLLKKAREWEIDSIFVGARRFSGAFERFWLGSVSTALVAKASCSVEIVRAPNH